MLLLVRSKIIRSTSTKAASSLSSWVSTAATSKNRIQHYRFRGCSSSVNIDASSSSAFLIHRQQRRRREFSSHKDEIEILSQRHKKNKKKDDSNSTSNTTTGGPDASTRDNMLLLYQRNSNYNGTLKRGTAFCFINTTFWGWYASQCAVSLSLSATTTTASASAATAADVSSFLVSPDVGLIGITTALLLNIAGYMYSSRLVSKIEYGTDQDQDQIIKVYGHFLWRESNKPQGTFALGDIYLDRNKEVKWLLEELKGDVTRFRGYLPLRVRDSSTNATQRFPVFGIL